jgi:hypothetical protein
MARIGADDSEVVGNVAATKGTKNGIGIFNTEIAENAEIGLGPNPIPFRPLCSLWLQC